jgi:hypothetical protein
MIDDSSTHTFGPFDKGHGRHKNKEKILEQEALERRKLYKITPEEHYSVVSPPVLSQSRQTISPHPKYSLMIVAPNGVVIDEVCNQNRQFKQHCDTWQEKDNFIATFLEKYELISLFKISKSRIITKVFIHHDNVNIPATLIIQSRAKYEMKKSRYDILLSVCEGFSRPWHRFPKRKRPNATRAQKKSKQYIAAQKSTEQGFKLSSFLSNTQLEKLKKSQSAK